MCATKPQSLNAVMTAYHLCEWVWGDFAKPRTELYAVWGISSADERDKQFKDYLLKNCSALSDAGKLTNGTKHFAMLLPTGKHHGGFQRGAFQGNAFDVSYLWIERNGEQQRVEDFIEEIVTFWETFFKKYGLS
ncbi:MAG: hypothetical protein WA441_00380 [Methyloceanibacter sp.]